MKYLLDTSICIYYFKGKYNLLDKLNETGFENCAISEVTLAELIYGAENSQNREKNFNIIEKFSEQILILPIMDAVYIYGKEKSRLRKRGTMISDLDLLIGSTAVSRSMIMVTRNVKEFDRIRDIKIENWIPELC